MHGELENRFQHHPPSTEQVAMHHQDIRSLCLGLARELVEIVPSGREQSLAITHLEEVMMWANAGIARNQ